VSLQELNNNSPLPFTLNLEDGRIIAKIGDAAHFFSSLTEEKRQTNHWTIAIRMLGNALKEPSYLRAATMSMQTALMLDGLLGSSQSS
jgi:hypothetical protein